MKKILEDDLQDDLELNGKINFLKKLSNILNKIVLISELLEEGIDNDEKLLNKLNELISEQTFIMKKFHE